MITTTTTIYDNLDDNLFNELTLTLHLADPEAWLKMSFAPGCDWSFTARITEGGLVLLSI